MVDRPQRTLLEADGLPVAARVARCEVPVGQPPDRLAAAELVVVIDYDEIVDLLPIVRQELAHRERAGEKIAA